MKTVEEFIGQSPLDKRLKFIELWLLNHTRDPKWSLHHRTYERLTEAKELQKKKGKI